MFLCFCRMMCFYSHQMPCLTIQLIQSTSDRYFCTDLKYICCLLLDYITHLVRYYMHMYHLDHVCFLVALFFRIGVKQETSSVSSSALWDIFPKSTFYFFISLLYLSVSELHICYKLNTTCSTVSAINSWILKGYLIYLNVNAQTEPQFVFS
jgi:hypothetical protein